jgi:hypothetical protein
MKASLYRELADLFFIESLRCLDSDEEDRLIHIAELLDEKSREIQEHGGSENGT